MLSVQTQQTAPQQLPAPSRIQFTFTGDALLVLGAFVWVFWDRFLRSRVVSKLDGVFAPIEEERVLNNVLAQIGVITNASRVCILLCQLCSADIYGGGITILSLVNVPQCCIPDKSADDTFVARCYGLAGNTGRAVLSVALFITCQFKQRKARHVIFLVCAVARYRIIKRHNPVSSAAGIFIFKPLVH